MDRINNIKLITVSFGKSIKLEIVRVIGKEWGYDKEETEVIKFSQYDKDKYEALETFVEVFGLMDKVTAKLAKEGE